MAGSGEVVTYRELDERSNRLAQLLWAQGLRPGDHVAIFAENHPRFFEVFWAAARSGLYFTTVNRYLQAEEAAYIVNDCGANAFVASAKADVAAEIVELILDCPLRLDVGRHGLRLRALRGPAAGPRSPRAPTPGRDDALLLGTTGRPKGIKRPLSGADVAAGLRLNPLLSGLFGMDAESIYLSPHRSTTAPAGLDHRRSPWAALPWSWSASTHRRHWSSSNGTGSPTASGCRRCSCAC